MPKVGKTHFAYTPAGKLKAENFAKKTGQKVTYKKGGETKKPKLGSGKRFSNLTSKLKKQGVKNPKALAASIGRKKYGAKKMASMAAKGRRSKG